MRAEPARALLARAGDPGPGWPIAVKDAIRTADLPTTFGTRAGVVVPGDGDATVVRRLRDAGAAIVAKTNCGELCIGAYVLIGTPENPRHPGHSVSGSSGGCAAAVAAGVVPASVGTDTGGSVRLPAAFCGVLGLKLTTGAVPLDGIVALAPSLDAVGVQAGALEPLRRTASALLGRRLEAFSGAPRIAVAAADESVDRDLTTTLDALPGRRIALELDGWEDAHVRIVGTEAVAVHQALLADPRLGAETRAVYEGGLTARLGDARRAGRRLREVIDGALRGVDVLVTPAADGPPPRVSPARGSRAFWGQLRWVAPINHGGHPALVVPLPRRPLAVQLVARHGEEATLLAVAAWLQARWGGS